ncbi:hypothetical protein MRS76_19320 [Rhizobiaceae bacterium n13]|uniref:hypothetical protein n=1 Tax=Ferirhizobium litorale TaxID=2927786 RepID=UPI0024B2D303|nr:hypothetical protein [Fererhizobium litorale]MDI7864103.1 hypothetical protein [Fererhizobium litorale]
MNAAAIPATKVSPVDDGAVARAMRELEHPIRSAHSMAYILAELLDEYLKDYREVDGKRPGGGWQIRLTEHEMEVLNFAWCDVLSRLTKLEKAFDAAWDGEVRS